MESRGNKIKFIIFIIFLIAIGIGGYFGMKHILKTGTSIWEKPEENTETPDLRVDKTKDYVIYSNIEEVMEDSAIYMQDININLSCAKLTNETLNKEMDEIRKSVVYTKDVTLDENVEYNENEEGIYSVDFRDYLEFEYEQYISIVVEDYTYDILNLQTAKGIKSFVFDKYEDIIISSSELLEKYNVTLDDVKAKIKTNLTASQESIEGEPVIKIDETINELNYAVFVNKTGNLEVYYLVKSTNSDYYDNIVLS